MPGNVFALNRRKWQRTRSLLETSPGLLLDASVYSSLSLSGSAVTQWSDLSGNGRNASQSSSGLRPTYSATGWDSGRPGITFSASRLDVASSSILANVAGYTALLIYSASGASRQYGLLGLAGSGATRILLSALLPSGTGDVYANQYSFAIRRLDADSLIATPQTNLAAFSSGRKLMHVGRADFGGTPTCAQWVDGTASGSRSSTTGSSSNTNGQIYIGDNPTGTAALSGTVALVAVWPSALSTNRRQWCEGVAAWAWGITLPSGHPYRDIAPTDAPPA